MSFVTDPPDFLVRVGGNILWSQAVVSVRMPLFGEGGIDGQKTVVVTYRLPSAIRAASSAGSVRYRSCPWMLLATKPPNPFSRARADILEVKLTSLEGCHSLDKLGFVT